MSVLSYISSTSLDRARHTHEWEPAAEACFYSQLEHGTRSRGGQRKRYKDMLKHNLKACSIDPKELETLAEDRSSWHAMCKASVQHFESVRVAELKKNRSLRKAGGRPTAGGFTCVTCACRICASRIGLYSHRRTHPHHPWPEIRRVDGSVHHTNISVQ